MAHSQPHFDSYKEPGTEIVHLICECMCDECFNVQPDNRFGCICPACDHNVKEEDEDQAGAPAGNSPADPTGG